MYLNLDPDRVAIFQISRDTKDAYLLRLDVCTIGSLRRYLQKQKESFEELLSKTNEYGVVELRLQRSTVANFYAVPLTLDEEDFIKWVDALETQGIKVGFDMDLKGLGQNLQTNQLFELIMAVWEPEMRKRFIILSVASGEKHKEYALRSR